MSYASAVVSVLGTVASVAGLLVALVQTIRLRELRRRKSADIWKLIATATAIIGEIEGSAAFKQGDPQICQIHGRISEQFRDLLKMAVLDEKSFTERTIRLWRSSGRVMNDWEEAQARRYLATSEIPEPEKK